MSEELTVARQLHDQAAECLRAAGIAVRDEEGGALGFEFEGTLCSLRAVTLAPGLDVLTLTCVLAWDRPLKPQLHKRVADRNNALQFGSLTIIAHEKQADVLLRYTFPAAGLGDDALVTMLLLVLSGASRARQGLVP
ncbi:hypothetical protein HGA08_03720 [Nocardia vermiculata]|uniref:Sensory transduction regulator n=1 Tax=Nocardia vermiculata TaxID=257274 RepID=A0A846XTZ4_9NOCA|nr:hypothetical protein [Nocardia vermiculata]